jgi:hypothetical protein
MTLNDLKVMEIMRLIQNNQKKEQSIDGEILGAKEPKVQQENHHQKKGSILQTETSKGHSNDEVMGKGEDS